MPLVPIAVSFLLGILLGTILPYSLLVVSIVASSFVMGAVLWRSARRRGLVSLLGLWMCLGLLRVLVWETHPSAGLVKFLSDEPQQVQLHGVVGDDPTETFTPRDVASQRCIVELRHLCIHHQWQLLL